MALADEVMDGVLAVPSGGDRGPGGVLGQLTKRLVERALGAELTEHLGYEPHQEPPAGAGKSVTARPKTLMTEHGPVEVDPAGSAGSFEPQIVRKHQRRFEGFDDKIIALYARGISTREIEAHLEEIYGVEVGRDLISRVTDAVLDDVREWQQRPLDDVYPVVCLDALVVKIRDGGRCSAGLLPRDRRHVDGERDVLGIWLQETEGAKFWMQVLTELKQRGVGDILLCCVDGLKGFPEAIEAIFPQTVVQTCIVHLIRQASRYVPDKTATGRRDLRPIYTAVEPTPPARSSASTTYGGRAPLITQAWRTPGRT